MQSTVQIEQAEQGSGAAAAQRNGNYAAQIMRDDAVPADGGAFSGCVPEDVIEARVSSVAHDGAGDLRVVIEHRAIASAARAETQRGDIVAQEDETPLCAGEAQRVLDHGAEHIVQHLRAIEALSRLKEQRELFQVRPAHLTGDALQQIARTRSGLRPEGTGLLVHRPIKENQGPRGLA